MTDKQARRMKQGISESDPDDYIVTNIQEGRTRRRIQELHEERELRELLREGWE